MTRPILEIRDLEKTYEGGFTALHSVSLDIGRARSSRFSAPTERARRRSSERSAASCSRPAGGARGRARHGDGLPRRAGLIGLVPQEVNLEPFEKVINTVRFSRGLFGKPRDDALIERVLRQLSLWDKRDSADPGAVGRHEAARADRQGAGA
jgi:ABC-2 type transport system ATP-binding protein